MDMASYDTVSAANVNGADDTALAVWLETSLAQRFERALDEPLPAALLEILEAEIQANASFINIRN